MVTPCISPNYGGRQPHGQRCHHQRDQLSHLNPTLKPLFGAINGNHVDTPCVAFTKNSPNNSRVYTLWTVMTI